MADDKTEDQTPDYTPAEPTPLATFVQGMKGQPEKNPYAPFTSEDQLTSTPPGEITPAEAPKPEAAVQEREPQSFEREYPGAPVAPPQPSAASQAYAAYAKQIPEDFAQEAAAAQEEKGARAAYAQDVGGAMGEEAEQIRGDALVRQAQAQEQQQAELGAIDEIHSLVRDYADGHIDPNQWWEEKSVPQKIGAVIGAMAAGLGGGVSGAMSYVNGMIDRNIARQQDAIHRKGAAAGEATNLLYSFMKSSSNAQEAFDKTRAAMLQASMVEVQRAATIAQSPIEAAKIDELLAAMQTQRDMAMAKLAASGGGAGGAGESGLQIDPKTIYTDPDTMLTYKVDNPEAMGQMIQTLDAYKKIKDSLREGDALLAARNELSWNDSKPWADSLQKGESLDGVIMENASKLALGRGVSAGIKDMVMKIKPEFGSRFAYLSRAKIPQIISTLDQYKDNILKAHGARHVQVQYGPGRGKHAGEMVPYAVLGSQYQTQQPQPSQAPKPTIDFRPAGQ